MTAPTPPFTGPISAAHNLVAFVSRRLGELPHGQRVSADIASVVVPDLIAAVLAGGQIRVEWGARYHAGGPDGDVDTWRDTREEAEQTIAARYQGVAPWPRPSSLIRRYVVVTAAEVVR